MKKFRIFAVLIMVVAFVTGCSMKSDFVIKVNANKKVTIGAVIAMDDDMIDTMLSMSNLGSDSTSGSEKHTDKERWEYVEESLLEEKDEDFTYEKYSEGKYKGYTMTSKAIDIDEISGASSDKINLAKFFGGDDDTDEEESVLFVKDGKYYVSNISFDSSESESFGEMNQYSSSMEFFEFKFVVSLPVKPVSNNADEVSADGKTLTWDLSKGAKDIEFKFSFDGAKDTKATKSNSLISALGGSESSDDNNSTEKKENKKDYTLYFVIGGAAVLVAGAIVFVGLNNKKKNA